MPRRIIGRVSWLFAWLIVFCAPSMAACVQGSLDPSSAESAEQQMAIAEHFTSRARLDLNPVIFGDAFAKPDWWRIAKRDDPDRVLKHEFAFFGVYRQFRSDIDWNGMVDQDRETIWLLNRFSCLMVLQEAHQQGRGERYLRKGIELMLDWVRKCPVEQAGELWGAWRPLEIGLRLNTWSTFLDYVAREGVIKPAELCTLLKSVGEQADYLASVTGPGRGNHGLMENSGLGVAALVFPELRGAKRWIDVVWRDFQSDARTQVYPDGSHIEMSPIYEFTCLFSLARVSYLADQRDQAVPEVVLEKLRAMNRYLTYIQKADGTLPAFNDGDRVDLNRFFAAIARWQKQPDVLWIATQGEEGTRPVSDDFAAEWSGLVVFRTGWTPMAQWLLLDAGPFGTSHQHLDTLQVEYSAFGQDFLVEPGRYTYRSDPIRHYLVSTRAHSTVTVDGGDQRSRRFQESWRSSRPIDLGFVVTEGVGFAQGVYSLGYEAPGAEHIIHCRSIFFVPDQCAVICDELRGQGEHEVTLHWSFPPLNVEPSGIGTVIARGDKANLLLKSVGPVPSATKVIRGQEKPPAGWFSEVYGVVKPAPHVEMTTRAVLPARFATLLVPFRTETPPSTDIEMDPNESEAVRVTIMDKTMELKPQGQKH